MIEKPYAHAGVVVDLGRAMATLGGALDVSWATVLSWGFYFWTLDGVRRVRSTLTCAMGGGPSIELLQEQSGSVGTSTHHIGHWSSGMAADAHLLRERNYYMVAILAGKGDGPTGFSYHAGPAGGLLVGLVDATLKPRFGPVGRWAGGRFVSFHWYLPNIRLIDQVSSARVGSMKKGRLQ